MNAFEKFFEDLMEAFKEGFNLQVLDVKEALESNKIKIDYNSCRVYLLAPSKYRNTYLMLQLSGVTKALIESHIARNSLKHQMKYKGKIIKETYKGAPSILVINIYQPKTTAPTTDFAMQITPYKIENNAFETIRKLVS